MTPTNPRTRANSDPAPQTAAQGALRARKRVLQAPQPTEAQLQNLIVSWLRWNGFIVMEVGVFDPRRRNTKGCPDLFVWHPKRPKWLALEVKTPTGRVKPEQAALVAQGASVIVRSLEDVIRAVGGGKP